MKSLVTKRDKGQVKMVSYPRENIDDRQENTIPLPFVFKMRCIRLIYRILQTNGSGIVFSCLSSMFSQGKLNFFNLAFIAFCDQALHNNHNMTQYLGRNKILNTKDNELNSVAISLLWHEPPMLYRGQINVAGIRRR